MIKQTLCALPIALALAGTASASKAPEDILDELAAKTSSSYLTQSPQNRMMMPDNPAYLVVEDGEKLFKQKRGPKNASLEQCDFGKGPGVLKGAYVELPRYFPDTGKVMDLESRLVHCMKTLQGFTNDDPAIKKRHGSDSDMMLLQSYIATQSNGMAWNPPLNHPLEKAMRNAGEVMFYRRSGTMDFNCATCHKVDGGRIRASVLPNIKKPEEWTKAISWPAYRTSQDNVRSSQHRVLECLWQMRYPNIKADSDAQIALISFWTDAARGQPAMLPDLKR
ncbi:MAG: sulfur oxidation c-type cytochrome SoxA [Thiobacillaceae bacterium]|jgi:sulfur-oxidizing protein SoxA|nr:sulfur oxidation c-type cytochrome SoxA [Thiobacillaceae bacterium]